eukprot:TRINITY_DN21768_c0_g3_i1.p1 TRINITY_DN21768_c0_g3~~TRINITY_DN21768_c0_g3_i1.p1  ORF type:complete len:522 (+),score=66.26 TRINITY_DN21768_c0_g3_i1:67-1566(+)
MAYVEQHRESGLTSRDVEVADFSEDTHFEDEDIVPKVVQPRRWRGALPLVTIVAATLLLASFIAKHKSHILGATRTEAAMELAQLASSPDNVKIVNGKKWNEYVGWYRSGSTTWKTAQGYDHGKITTPEECAAAQPPSEYNQSDNVFFTFCPQYPACYIEVHYDDQGVAGLNGEWTSGQAAALASSGIFKANPGGCNVYIAEGVPSTPSPSSPPTLSPSSAPTPSPSSAPTSSPSSAPTPSPSSAPPPPSAPAVIDDAKDKIETTPACYPGDAYANVENRGATLMEELRVGDRILVQNSAGGLEFEPVLAFLHAHRSAAAEMPAHVIEVTHMHGVVRASPGHLLLTANSQDKLAKDILPGDQLRVAQGMDVVSSNVLSVRLTKSDRGAFAPLTAAGNLVVDMVVASNYASPATAGLARVTHPLAHAVLFPVRLYHRVGIASTLAPIWSSVCGTEEPSWWCGGNGLPHQSNEHDDFHPFIEVVYNRLRLDLFHEKLAWKW